MIRLVAAAQGLARRVVLYERADGDDADRLNYAFQLCTARLPEPTESRVLLVAGFSPATS